MINTDGDLYRKKIGNEDQRDKITTDVSRCFVLPSGKFVYIVDYGTLFDGAYVTLLSGVEY